MTDQPGVFAPSAVIIKGVLESDLWFLTYPTPNLLKWYSENSPESHRAWSKINNNQIIGHYGESFRVIGLNRDVILCHVQSVNPLILDYCSPGTGTSLALALHALPIAQRRLNVAFSGQVNGHLVSILSPLVAYAKNQICLNKGIPLVTHGSSPGIIDIRSTKALNIIDSLWEKHSFANRRKKFEQQGNQRPAQRNQNQEQGQIPHQPQPQQGNQQSKQFQKRNQQTDWKNNQNSRPAENKGYSPPQGMAPLRAPTVWSPELFRERVINKLNNQMFPTGRWGWDYNSSRESRASALIYARRAASFAYDSLSVDRQLLVKATVQGILNKLEATEILMHSGFKKKVAEKLASDQDYQALLKTVSDLIQDYEGLSKLGNI